MKYTSCSRVIALFSVLLAVATACSTPTPTGPAAANGSPAIITNPAGGGPQQLRYGPPNYHAGENMP